VSSMVVGVYDAQEIISMGWQHVVTMSAIEMGNDPDITDLVLGTVAGRRRHVHDHGKLTASPREFEFEVFKRLNLAHTLGPGGGPYTTTREEHLASPLSCYVLIKNTLRSVSEETGDIPEVPSVPDSAIP